MAKLLDLILRIVFGNPKQTNWQTFGKRRT
jgi:hypothetical protein